MAQYHFFYNITAVISLRKWIYTLILFSAAPHFAWSDDVTNTTVSSENEYWPGSGLEIPGTGFKIGGYATVGNRADLSQPQSREFGLNDFSLLMHWEGEGKLRFFSELDFQQLLTLDQGSNITQHASVDLERLYADYMYSDKLNFRAGKFLTPIGRWNVIHASPLEWTTSRPLITEYMFPTNVTGGMVFGTVPALGKEVDYSGYASSQTDWGTAPNVEPFNDARGMHAIISVNDDTELGVSFAEFNQQNTTFEQHQELLGLDYYWSRNGYEISAELAYRSSGLGGLYNESGLYVQGVIPLSNRWYAISRYEYYDRPVLQASVNLFLAGVAFRLTPGTLLKAEVSHATQNQPWVTDGFLTSIALLF